MAGPSSVTCNAVVVLVEDEVVIRVAAVGALADAGFDVLEAENAGQAIDILRSEAARVDILFSDVNMPGGMNGMMLAHHARAHWPWIGLLLTSGQVKPHPGELPENCRFVAKPYDLDLVARHIREIVRAA